MAFSTTTDYALSAEDLVTEALEQLGVLEEGESPSADQITSALRTLNMMIKSWSADYLIFAQAELTVDLTASTADYFFGNSSGAYIPQKILHATLINTSTDDELPLELVSRQEWDDLPDKTTEGVPTTIYYKTGAVNQSANLKVWPVPSDTTYDIKLWVQYPLRDIDTSTDDLFFSQEWFLALSFGLAYYLSPKYSIPVGERDRFKADMIELRDEASSYNTEQSVFFEPDLSRRS